MLKKFPLLKIKSTKNVLFFLSRAPTHHSFTFNLWFLYGLKHKVLLSGTVWEAFDFWLCFFFIKVYIFVHQNAWIRCLQNVIIPLKIKITEKTRTVLLPNLWFLSYNKKFQNSMISAWVGVPQKLTCWKKF